ncbi:MAG: aminodeoxychorismate/anthranilate synthase component II [Firmicutes bacterium]|nr:aminodeoxychorismate/anthranilate synthase component II [Bacillota bacterium]
MLLIIDNYDSFTYNLAQYFSMLGVTVKVIRNDSVRAEDIEKMAPSALVISPGPGGPDTAGISKKAIDMYAGRIPVLGVCLGHQAIGSVYGGSIIRAKTLMHGKTSLINHDGKSVFRDIPQPFSAIRYHSLVVEGSTLPPCLEISAWTGDGEIMGLRHRSLNVEGVQFHPESILTDHGLSILRNFLVNNGLYNQFREVV